jgi:hypothetical protein
LPPPSVSADWLCTAFALPADTLQTNLYRILLHVEDVKKSGPGDHHVVQIQEHLAGLLRLELNEVNDSVAYWNILVLLVADEQQRAKPILRERTAERSGNEIDEPILRRRGAVARILREFCSQRLSFI